MTILDKEKDILVKLLSDSLKSFKTTLPYIDSNIDIEKLYREALYHKVHTIIFPLVSKVFNKSNNIFENWKNTTIQSSLSMIVNNERAIEVLNRFNDAGIDVIVLKGIALRRLYPRPELRLMGDVDLLVHEEDLNRATSLLENLGYVSSKNKTEKHIIFYHKQFLNIELHRSLIEHKCIQNPEDFDKSVWNNTVLFNNDKSTVFVLNNEYQILHLIIHMVFHFLYGGFGFRQISDLLLLIEINKCIDWNLIIKKASEYGIEKFMITLFKLCRELFQIKIPPEMNVSFTGEDKFIRELKYDIFLGGDLGGGNSDRKAANLLIKYSKKKIEDNIILKYLSFIFAQRNKLLTRYRYRYIKKYPFLIPIAWIHRIIYGIFRRDYSWKTKFSIFTKNEPSEIAYKRNELLIWLNLR